MFRLTRPFLLILITFVTSAAFTACLKPKCGLSDFKCNPDLGLIFLAFGSRCTYSGNFEKISDTNASFSGILSDVYLTRLERFGNTIYAAGGATDIGSGNPRGIIISSQDEGLTWKTEFVDDAGTTGASPFSGLSINPLTGDIFAVREATSIAGDTWIIATNAGGAWVNADFFQPGGSNTAEPAAGVYVPGAGFFSAGRATVNDSLANAEPHSTLRIRTETPIFTTPFFTQADDTVSTYSQYGDIIYDGTDIYAVGSYGNEGGNDTFFLDRISTTGTQTRLNQTPFNCCYDTEERVQMPVGLSVTPSGSLIFGTSPGTVINDARATWVTLDQNGNVVSSNQSLPFISQPHDSLTVGGAMFFSHLGLDADSAPTGSPFVTLSPDDGQTHELKLDGSTANGLNDGPTGGRPQIRLVQLVDLPDGSVLASTAVDPGIAPGAPTFFYKLDCR